MKIDEKREEEREVKKLVDATRVWDYPCCPCRLYMECDSPFKPYGLILHATDDEYFRKLVKKYGLSEREATWMIMQFIGTGVCVHYKPNCEPLYTTKAEKAKSDYLHFLLKERNERWDCLITMN